MIDYFMIRQTCTSSACFYFEVCLVSMSTTFMHSIFFTDVHKNVACYDTITQCSPWVAIWSFASVVILAIVAVAFRNFVNHAITVMLDHILQIEVVPWFWFDCSVFCFVVPPQEWTNEDDLRQWVNDLFDIEYMTKREEIFTDLISEINVTTLVQLAKDDRGQLLKLLRNAFNGDDDIADLLLANIVGRINGLPSPQTGNPWH